MGLTVALATSLLFAAGDPGLAAIDHDLAAGELSEDEASVQRFYRLFLPAEGAPRYNDEAFRGEPRCGTSVLTDVSSRWDRLTGEVRHDVAHATDPFYRAWVRSGGLTWEEGDVRAARAAERSTCFDPQDIAGFSAYQNQTTSDDDWVTIHWNEGGLINAERIGWMAGWFDEAFAIQVSDQGFFAPRNITTNELLVIVEDLGTNSLFGYTSLAACGLGDAMAYIVMNARHVDDQVSLRPTAAHELFHAIQQVYAFEEMWSRDSPNRWWLEGSAVYAASTVFPFDQDRHAGHTYNWALEPWRSLLTHQGREGLFQYGTSTWAMSVGTSLDDPDWHREFWEQLRDREGYALVDEFDDYLQTRGTSFAEQYRLFVRRGATGDWSDNPYTAGPYVFADDYDTLTGDHEEDDYPVERRIDSDAGPRPEYLGTNHVRFDPGRLDRELGLVVEFRGDASKNDVDVDWVVELVVVEDGSPEDAHSMELELDGGTGELVGSVLLNRFRRQGDHVILAVSPVSDFGDGGITWTYSASLIDSIQDGGFSDVPDPEPPPDDDGGCATCGASAVGAASPGWALLLGVLAARRRRHV